MEKRSSKRVVITGSGVLSPLGQDLGSYCRALQAGKVAVRAITYDAPGGTTTRMVAPLQDIPLAGHIAKTETRFYSKLSRVAAFCAENAMAEAKLAEGDFDGGRAGVLFGSGFINLYDLESVYEDFFTGDERHLSPLVIPINMASCPTGRLSVQYGFRGTTRTVSTACASSSTALADAYKLIARGDQDIMLAGGADLICCVSLVRSWERLRILCPANNDPAMACRPFDRSRNGLSLGDGGALFVLEEREHARRRGATILAEVAGAFENADGFDMLKPAADGEVLCMQGALNEAGMTAADIDMVQAHGTATQLNDATEFSALQRVFGSRVEEIPVAAIKSMIGHTMGASGALSVVAAIGSLANGYIYPIPGFRAADDDVHINVSATGRLADNVNAVLVNAFGFGGANACLVIAAGGRDD